MLGIEGGIVSLFWSADSSEVTCRACGFSGLGIREVSFVDSVGEERDGVRCPECDSLDILDSPLDSSPTDESVDVYVEAGCGVGSIADALTRSGSTSVSRLLDVGCNYGFGLDIARRTFGWQVVGMEPSLAGARGARELGVDIRTEYLTRESTLHETFDVVMAIEVIEHIPDPVGFLETVRAALAPGGVLVMTTPAAEIVNGDEDESDVLMALSPGYHVFLASVSGMTRLLARAGFGAVEVLRDHGTLRVRASTESLPQASPAPFDLALLQSYYETAGRGARRGSALRLGLLTRWLRLAVARGQWQAARRAARMVRIEFQRRYRLDLDRPVQLAQRFRAGEAAPWALIGAAFALGMLELLDRSRPRRAAEQFDLVIAAIQRWRANTSVLDLDTADLADQAVYHLALALARIDSSAVPEAVAGWPTPRNDRERARGDARIARLAVELVSRGEDAAAQALSADLVGCAIRAAESTEPSMAIDGRDGLYAVGVLALRGGRPEQARELLELCVTRCAETTDPGAQALMRLARATLGAVESATATKPARSVTSFLDVYWCDASGTYLRGWAHVDGRPGAPTTVSIGDRRVTANAGRRDDLRAFWPDTREVVDSGYSAYVPGPPAGRVKLTLTIGHDEVEDWVTLPDHPLPTQPEIRSRELLQERVLREISNAPAGPILTVGLRRSGEELEDATLSRVTDRDLIGVDIHPGHGVDIVADAHRLEDAVGGRRFPVVYSASFLEHAATPWLFAQQCAAVLEPGGIAVHFAPWVWPTHAQPNDFWRFSTAGLERLFSGELGFETVLVGEFGQAVITPAPDWRESATDMATHSVPTFACIVARKVRASEHVEWPYTDAAEFTRARLYPVDGIVLGPS